MRSIKASELVSYLYCQRAWWYQLKGTPSENQAELANGIEVHHRHGRKILMAGVLETLGWVMILLAGVALVVGATLMFLQ